MLKTLLWGLALACCMPASARPQTPTESAGVQLVAVRFYRSAGGQTLVDVLSQVPLAQLDQLTPGSGGVASYRFSVAVRDTAGLELLQQSWTRNVPARLLSARGSSGELFSFAARPGRYTIEVTVTDSATGRIARGRLAMQAYAAQPPASDLLLATAARQAAAENETPSVGEVKKGALVFQTAVHPVLTPQNARLSYYVELYRERAETVTVAGRVMTGGRQFVATPPQRIELDAGGGVSSGSVELAGLPPGDYEFEVRVAAARDTIVRRAPFRMAGFETEAAIADLGPSEDVFAVMTEEQLDTLYLPLVYLWTAEEQGAYPGLTLEGKRRWLRRFWQKRDPTPGTAANEAQEDFYRRIAEANRRFREGGAAEIPGWRTDRGRIFVKYGPPSETLSRPQAGNTRPYEIWKFSRGRAVKYVFLDQTLFGNYVLIWTDDRREPSRPNWQELLGPEAVIEVERF